MVLLLEKLIKIDIHRLVQNDYWAATVGDYRLELNPIRSGANYFLTLSFEDVVREPVVAQELPNVFDRIELGAFWRQ